MTNLTFFSRIFHRWAFGVVLWEIVTLGTLTAKSICIEFWVTVTLKKYMKYDIDGVVAIYAFFIMLNKRRQRSVGHLAHDHFSNRCKNHLNHFWRNSVTLLITAPLLWYCQKKDTQEAFVPVQRDLGKIDFFKVFLKKWLLGVYRQRFGFRRKKEWQARFSINWILLALGMINLSYKVISGLTRRRFWTMQVNRSGPTWAVLSLKSGENRLYACQDT